MNLRPLRQCFMLFTQIPLKAILKLTLATTLVAIMAKKAKWAFMAMAICVINRAILGVQLKSIKKQLSGVRCISIKPSVQTLYQHFCDFVKFPQFLQHKNYDFFSQFCKNDTSYDRQLLIKKNDQVCLQNPILLEDFEYFFLQKLKTILTISHFLGLTVQCELISAVWLL